MGAKVKNETTPEFGYADHNTKRTFATTCQIFVCPINLWQVFSNGYNQVFFSATMNILVRAGKYILNCESQVKNKTGKHSRFWLCGALYQIGHLRQRSSK